MSAPLMHRKAPVEERPLERPLDSLPATERDHLAPEILAATDRVCGELDAAALYQ